MTDGWHYTIIRTIKDGHIKILPDIRSSSPCKKQSPSLNKLEFSLSYIVLCRLVEMYLSYFITIHPWKRAWPLFEQTWILSVLAFPDGCPWKRKGPSFEQTWIPFIQRKFWNFVNVFSLFHNYSPFRRGHGRLFKKKLNPLHPRMICANFGWNWPSDSWE